METNEERKARLEKMVSTKRFRLAMEMDKESKVRQEKMAANLALESEEKRNGFDLD